LLSLNILNKIITNPNLNIEEFEALLVINKFIIQYINIKTEYIKAVLKTGQRDILLDSHLMFPDSFFNNFDILGNNDNYYYIKQLFDFYGLSGISCKRFNGDNCVVDWLSPDSINLAGFSITDINSLVLQEILKNTQAKKYTMSQKLKKLENIQNNIIYSVNFIF